MSNLSPTYGPSIAESVGSAHRTTAVEDKRLAFGAVDLLSAPPHVRRQELAEPAPASGSLEAAEENEADNGLVQEVDTG